jgi:hypothetical protein
VIAISWDPLRRTWLPYNLQQTPACSRVPSPGYRRLTTLPSTPRHKLWFRGVKSAHCHWSPHVSLTCTISFLCAMFVLSASWVLCLYYQLPVCRVCTISFLCAVFVLSAPACRVCVEDRMMFSTSELLLVYFLKVVCVMKMKLQFFMDLAFLRWLCCFRCFEVP